MTITPRNKKQLEHAQMTKRPAMSGGGPLHLVNTDPGSTEEKQAAELDQAKIQLFSTKPSSRNSGRRNRPT
jgi:hypothetical protein